LIRHRFWHQTCIDISNREASGVNLKGHLMMGLSAILIATALSLTMLVAVSDFPVD
jgi:hypothetical protein